MHWVKTIRYTTVQWLGFYHRKHTEKYTLFSQQVQRGRQEGFFYSFESQKEFI